MSAGPMPVGPMPVEANAATVWGARGNTTGISVSGTWGNAGASGVAAAPVTATSARRATSFAVGLRAGSTVRQAATNSVSTGCPIRARSHSTRTIRPRTADAGPIPKGASPVAAANSTPPRANTSDVRDARCPPTCSGARYAVVAGMPVARVARSRSTGGAIPNPPTRGPSWPTTTCEGVRSRWTTPAACTCASPSATARAKAGSWSAGSGPCAAIRSASVGPLGSAQTTQGRAAVGSASSTGRIRGPLTVRAAVTSAVNRARAWWSSAHRSSSTVSATGRPRAERPRNTVPSGVAPSLAASAYSPSRRGSLAFKGSVVLTCAPPVRQGGSRAAPRVLRSDGGHDCASTWAVDHGVTGRRPGSTSARPRGGRRASAWRPDRG